MSLVYISNKKSGFAHPKCYLSYTNGCSTKITGEHCISHNLLNKIEQQNKTINIMGLSWLPKEQLVSIGKTSLVSNVLCSQHNSDLSPLDSSIGDLVTAIGNIDAEYQNTSPTGLKYTVDGAHIERWILKTMLGLVKSEQIKQHTGNPFVIKTKCLDLLCSPHLRWPLGWGLYVAIPEGNTYHSSSFELQPKHNQNTGELLALCLKFNGIEMNFLMGKPDNPSTFGIHRPSMLVFEKGVTKSNILFNWQKQKAGSLVTFTNIGTYSGEAPDHHQLI